MFTVMCDFLFLAYNIILNLSRILLSYSVLRTNRPRCILNIVILFFIFVFIFFKFGTRICTWSFPTCVYYLILIWFFTGSAYVCILSSRMLIEVVKCLEFIMFFIDHLPCNILKAVKSLKKYLRLFQLTLKYNNFVIVSYNSYRLGTLPRLWIIIHINQLHGGHFFRRQKNISEPFNLV